MAKQLTQITVFKNGKATHSNRIEIEGTLDANAVLQYCGYIGRELGAMLGYLPVQAERGPEGSVTLTMWTESERAVAGPLRVTDETLEEAGLKIGKRKSISVQAPRQMSLSPLDVCLPVIAGQHQSDGKFRAAAAVIYGTAFPFWYGGLFLTAGHVLKDAQADGVAALGKTVRDGSLSAFAISDSEIIESIDLGIFRCPAFERLQPMPIDFSHALGTFSPVSALGYPFSIDHDYLTMVHRGFIGHVVAFRRFYQLLAQPFGYELSFMTPPGMSGAPLIGESNGSSYGYGYIIQQSTTIIRGERVDLGLAVAIDVLLGIESKVVGGSIAKLFDVAPRTLPRKDLTWQERHAKQMEEELKKGWPDDEG